MAPLRAPGQYLPTTKLTDLERLILYDVRGIEIIVTQGSPRTYVIRTANENKCTLVKKWIAQDELISRAGEANYASTPGEDELLPQSLKWKRFQTMKSSLLEKLRHAVQAGWTLDEAWAAEEAMKSKKGKKARGGVKAANDEDPEGEAESTARKDENIKEKLTKAQLTAQLDALGITYLSNSKWRSLHDLLKKEERARQLEQSKDDGHTTIDEADGDVAVQIASHPEPPQTTKSPTKKRKRQAKEDDKSSRKRTKAGATKSVEVEGAVHVEDIMDDEDAHMTDADDDLEIAPPPQKKTIARKKLPKRSDLSKRTAASKVTSKGTPSLGAKLLMLKQATSMTKSGSDGNPVSLENEMDVGDQRGNGFDDKEVRDERAKSSAPRPLPRSRSTPARSTTTQAPDRATTAQKKKASLTSIDEGEEDSDSHEKETLAIPTGRASRRLASKATGSTRATRSRGTLARDTTNPRPAHEKDQGGEKKYWFVRHHTDNYSDHIPLSETKDINPDSLEYPQLISWNRNMEILARREAKAEGKPRPPKSTKKKKYDYRKDPKWWIADD